MPKNLIHPLPTAAALKFVIGMSCRCSTLPGMVLSSSLSSPGRPGHQHTAQGCHCLSHMQTEQRMPHHQHLHRALGEHPHSVTPPHCRASSGGHHHPAALSAMQGSDSTSPHVLMFWGSCCPCWLPPKSWLHVTESAAASATAFTVPV